MEPSLTPGEISTFEAIPPVNPRYGPDEDQMASGGQEEIWSVLLTC